MQQNIIISSLDSQAIASPTAAVMQGRRVFSAACRHGWPHLMIVTIIKGTNIPTRPAVGRPQENYLRQPSGWYSGALVVFWPAVVEMRSKRSVNIQRSFSFLQLCPILATAGNWLDWSWRKVSEILLVPSALVSLSKFESSSGVTVHDKITRTANRFSLLFGLLWSGPFVDYVSLV